LLWIELFLWVPGLSFSVLSPCAKKLAWGFVHHPVLDPVLAPRIAISLADFICGSLIVNRTDGLKFSSVVRGRQNGEVLPAHVPFTTRDSPSSLHSCLISLQYYHGKPRRFRTKTWRLLYHSLHTAGQRGPPISPLSRQYRPPTGLTETVDRRSSAGEGPVLSSLDILSHKQNDTCGC